MTDGGRILCRHSEVRGNCRGRGAASGVDEEAELGLFSGASAPTHSRSRSPVATWRISPAASLGLVGKRLTDTLAMLSVEESRFGWAQPCPVGSRTFEVDDGVLRGLQGDQSDSRKYPARKGCCWDRFAPSRCVQIGGFWREAAYCETSGRLW